MEQTATHILFWAIVVLLIFRERIDRFFTERRVVKLMRAGLISQDEARKIVLKAEGIDEE